MSHDSVNMKVPRGCKEPAAGPDECVHHQIMTKAG